MLFLLLKHCAKCDSDSRNVGIVFFSLEIIKTRYL